MARRLWPSLLLLITLLTIGLTSYACRTKRQPNVLVVTIDTLRADHLGSYGYALARTPVLDRLAAEGVRCSNAIASAPITMPSHSSIFTGLFPPAHGVRDNGAYALGEDAVTLAERLRSVGYTTHAFVSAIVLNRRYNLDQGFESYDDDLWAEDDPKLFMIRERQAPKTTDRFLKWFGDWDQKRAKPFFAWIHYFDPHQPYRPYRPFAPDTALAASPYDAEIAGVDGQIGRIVESLRGRGVLDDTLLIITADHGESLGEHGEKTHAIFVYDATVRVPLILRYPAVFKPAVYDDPIRSVDLVPTVLGVLGLEGSRKVDGLDLGDALRGREKAPVLAQYSESLLSEVGFGMAPLFAIRSGGYKFIRAPRPELYDLRKDPRELHNLQSELPRVARRLDLELTKMLEGSAAHAVKAAANPLTKETEESLRALGYLASPTDRSSLQGMDPKDALPLHVKLEDARHAAQNRDWTRAETLLLEVLAITPRNVSALNILGLIGVKTGDRDMALKYYTQSLGVDRDQFRVYGVLGAISMSNGEFDRATEEFRAALAINPNFAEAMANLGFIQSLQGNDREAEEWYRKGVAADPAYPRVQRRLGDLYYERGNYDRAYAAYSRVIELTPSDVRATLQAGNSARRLGKTAQADTLFRRAEALRPDGWIPTFNRACLLSVSGKPEEALQLLTTLAARRPVPLALVERDTDLTAVRALKGYPALREQLSDTGEDELTE